MLQCARGRPHASAQGSRPPWHHPDPSQGMLPHRAQSGHPQKHCGRTGHLPPESSLPAPCPGRRRRSKSPLYSASSLLQSTRRPRSLGAQSCPLLDAVLVSRLVRTCSIPCCGSCLLVQHLDETVTLGSIPADLLGCTLDGLTTKHPDRGLGDPKPVPAVPCLSLRSPSTLGQ